MGEKSRASAMNRTPKKKKKKKHPKKNYKKKKKHEKCPTIGAFLRVIACVKNADPRGKGENRAVP